REVHGDLLAGFLSDFRLSGRPNGSWRSGWLTVRRLPGSAAGAYQGDEVTDPVDVPQLVRVDDGVDRLDLILGDIQAQHGDQVVVRIEGDRPGLTVDLRDMQAHATA